MCDACKELSKVFDYTQNMIVSKFNNKKNGRATFLIVQEQRGGKPQSVTIEVNFCPWCGARLKGECDAAKIR